MIKTQEDRELLQLIYTNPEEAKAKLLNPSTPPTKENIETMINALYALRKELTTLREIDMKRTREYRELYMQVHNIPKNAIVEWRN
jgi:hypothetical protein